MTTEQNQNTEDSKPIVRYKWEYKNFLAYVKGHKVQRAMVYAKTLGIDRRTLANWVNQPELREALTEAIDEVIDGMKQAGKNDWRMYVELYKMLGLDDVKNIDVTSDGEKLTIALVEFIGDNSDNKENS